MYADAFKSMGFDENTKFSLKVLRGLCEFFGAEERKAAKEKGEPAPEWVDHFDSMSKEDLGELVLEVETKSNGHVNLQRFDKRLGLFVETPVVHKLDYKQRLLELKVKKGSKKAAPEEPPRSAAKTPQSAAKGARKGKGAGPKPVVLKNIGAHLIDEWLCHETYVGAREKAKDLDTRAAPNLKNWNDGEVQRWGLGSTSGARCYLFLADSFQVKAMVRDEETKCVVIYVTYIMELNGLHLFEWLYHAKVYLDKNEDVRDVEARKIQCFKNGNNYPLNRGEKPDFKEWIEHVHVPDVFVSSQPSTEY